MAIIVQEKGEFLLYHQDRVVAKITKMRKNYWRWLHGLEEEYMCFAEANARLHKLRDQLDPPAIRGMALARFSIFTDGSHCQETGAAGMAWWARGEGPDRCIGARAKVMDNSTHAELGAAMLGLNHSMDHFRISNAMIVLVSDCEAVRTFMTGVSDHNATEKMVAFRDKTLDRMFRAGVHLKVNHVKAHTSAADARSWVNGQVDRKAYNAMHKLRKSLRRDRKCQ